MATRSNASSAAEAGSFSKFRVATDSGAVRKRTKFDSKQRQKVKAVRKRRACLRCSLLHIPCSDDDLCKTCESLAFVLQAHEKQTLSFSGCIRTRLPEVSVFEIYLPPPGVHFSALAQNNELGPANISLDFASHMTWSLEALVNDIVDWLNNPIHPKTSKVGTLSSPQFVDLVEPLVEGNIRMNFQLMIYAISLAYTLPTVSGKHSIHKQDLIQIGSIAGHNFLKALDEKLKPQSLKYCSGDGLRALFLMVFGTILAVGYTECGGLSQMQDHLCQILAHYVIYLASKLELPITSGADQFLLEAALTRWHRKGLFEWRIARPEKFECKFELRPGEQSEVDSFNDPSSEHHDENTLAADSWNLTIPQSTCRDDQFNVHTKTQLLLPPAAEDPSPGDTGRDASVSSLRDWSCTRPWFTRLWRIQEICVEALSSRVFSPAYQSVSVCPTLPTPFSPAIGDGNLLKFSTCSTAQSFIEPIPSLRSDGPIEEWCTRCGLEPGKLCIHRRPLLV